MSGFEPNLAGGYIVTTLLTMPRIPKCRVDKTNATYLLIHRCPRGMMVKPAVRRVCRAHHAMTATTRKFPFSMNPGAHSAPYGAASETMTQIVKTDVPTRSMGTRSDDAERQNCEQTGSSEAEPAMAVYIKFKPALSAPLDTAYWLRRDLLPLIFLFGSGFSGLIESR